VKALIYTFFPGNLLNGKIWRREIIFMNVYCRRPSICGKFHKNPMHYIEVCFWRGGAALSSIVFIVKIRK
jgi:hypothetical protein